MVTFICRFFLSLSIFLLMGYGHRSHQTSHGHLRLQKAKVSSEQLIMPSKKSFKYYISGYCIIVLIY